MQDHKIYIYLSVLTVVVLLLLSFLPEYSTSDMVKWISFISIATVGILHGANDFLIYNSSTNTNISAYTFIGFYIAFAAIIGVIIYLDPVIGMNLFVLISAFHFGEEHFSWWKEQKNIAFLLWCFVYGLTIFSLLFLTHLETLEVFLLDNGYEPSTLSWSYFFLTPILVVQVVLSLAHLFLQKINWKLFVFLQGTLVLLYLIFTKLDLLSSFAFYFVFWHSLPSIISQTKALNFTGINGLSRYLINALPFYLMSLIGIGLLYLWMGSNMLALSTIVLIGSMTTIPHIVVFIYLRVVKDKG